ncbi:hypothetical protein V6N13_064601 [Hibiscus sabdariffa]
MDLKIFVWNAQGCGSTNFLRVTRQYVWDHRPDICVFVETRVSKSRADVVIVALNFPNSHRIEAIRFADRIWLYLFVHIHIDLLSCHFQFLHCKISTANHASIFASFVYASPNNRLRPDAWSSLKNLVASISEPWIVIGDFNATLTLADRQGCAASSLPYIKFQNMVFDCGLQDLDYNGLDFTWYQGNCSVRLDRCFGNAAWFESYPTSYLQYLLRMKSDHRPLFLSHAHSS